MIPIAKFLHRLVGYPDQDHDPNIDGMRPGGLGFLEDARRSITWPDERLNCEHSLGVQSMMDDCG